MLRANECFAMNTFQGLVVYQIWVGFHGKLISSLDAKPGNLTQHHFTTPCLRHPGSHVSFSPMGLNMDLTVLDSDSFEAAFDDYAATLIVEQQPAVLRSTIRWPRFHR